MQQANFTNTIGITIHVAAHEAPAFLQRLLPILPQGATASTGAMPPPAWPAVPVAAGSAYQRIAEDNLRRLREDDIPDDGWGGVQDLDKVVRSLRAETSKVVLRAIENGGHVSRDEVYALLGRDKEQSLKGFTKPVAGLMERLVASGQLAADAKPLLQPIYEKSRTYQQAQGFMVPVQVVSLLATA